MLYLQRTIGLSSGLHVLLYAGSNMPTSDHGVLYEEGEEVDGTVLNGVPQDVQPLALVGFLHLKVKDPDPGF